MFLFCYTEVFQMLLHYALCCLGASGCEVKRGTEKESVCQGEYSSIYSG